MLRSRRAGNRTRLLAALTGVLFAVAIPAVARAHDGGAHTAAEEGFPNLAIGIAAGFALGGVALGGVALGGMALSGRGSRLRLSPRLLGLGAAALLVAASSTLAVTWYTGIGEARPDSGGQRYEGVALDGEAPGFTLTDQRGDEVSLAALRGRVVLLAFLDPNCTDICPLTAFHFRSVSEALDDDAERLALLAVNVNPEAALIEDVAAAGQRWGMENVTPWHFLTGTKGELAPVWADYSVIAGAPKAEKPGEVAHTPGVFVIDRSGERRWYVSIPHSALLDQPWDGPPMDEVLLEHVRALLGE